MEKAHTKSILLHFSEIKNGLNSSCDYNHNFSLTSSQTENLILSKHACNSCIILSFQQILMIVMSVESSIIS